MDHQICEACECVNHCRKNGCIPITPVPTNSALHMMEGQGERDRFEASMKARNRPVSRTGGGEYVQLAVEIAWAAWQDRAALDKTALSHSADKVEASGEAEKHEAEGWQWVPVEPTPEMIGAMSLVECTATCINKFDDGSEEEMPILGMAGSEEAYAAMLKRAPSAGETTRFAIPPSNDVATLQQELALAYEGIARERGIVSAIKSAVAEYFYALDIRQHGGVAQDRAFNQICAALDLHWVQGAEAARRAVTAEKP